MAQHKTKKIAFGDNFKRFSQWYGKVFYTFLYYKKNNILILLICVFQVLIYGGKNSCAEVLPDQNKAEEAKRAVRLEDFTLAAKLFKHLAEIGDLDAQYRLGVLYQTGLGVKKDYTKAFYFFKQAAGREYPKALYSLAQMFENGWGTNSDYQQALALYQQAASKGYAQAVEKIKLIKNEGWPSQDNSSVSKNHSLSVPTTGVVLALDGKAKAGLAGELLNPSIAEAASPGMSLKKEAVLSFSFERFKRFFLLSPKYGFGFLFGILGTLWMSLLFIYSLRKRKSGWEKIGSTKLWLRLHMVLGIIGPVFILVHCNFHLGALNSNMALFSMLIVAISGVIGRYIYARVHYDLYGELANLVELKSKFEGQKEEAGLHFAYIPGAKEELFSFTEDVLDPSVVLRESIRRFLSLRNKSRITFQKIQKLSTDYINSQALENNWKFFSKLKMRIKLRKKTRIFIDQTMRIAEFNLYERLFSFWHMVHIPLVFTLVISVLMHIFAVKWY